LVCTLQAQTALYNTGNLRIHNEGRIGFHTNLINDGSFDENMGLAGFYGTDFLAISGAFTPIFFDAELANDFGVFLNTTVGITNNFNFITGHVSTPRENQDVFLNFMENAFYTGESNLSMVDGYTTVINRNTFTFPVGDNDRLRPLTIESTSINPLAKCAYFFEDPNTPFFFENGFNTDLTESNFLSISTQEFWKIEGNQSSKITLTWDALSNITVLGETTTDLKVVGWSKASNRWVNLGNTNVEGDMASGSLTSDFFTPINYEIITIGGTNNLYETLNTTSLGNFYMSPNGDGINDVLIIEELTLSPNNSLSLYNRAGLKVFEEINYTNEFTGFSNMDNLVVNREQGLPEGFYFYVIYLDDLNLNYQGFLYLKR